ncbi:MAG TPA: NPCBM/NEW2 domain-containing protein, partial [Phycisphaerae bacterium]|nr:NPCBM/NEW2 domain-containing protein [Phycisphaerae bacterium]
MVLLVGVASPARAGKTVWLDELDVTRSTCGWQTTQRNRSVGGNPLRLGGQRFRRGVGTHAPGKISV